MEEPEQIWTRTRRRWVLRLLNSGGWPRRPTCATAWRACLGWRRASWSLESLLTRVATYAVQAIPGADGAGLTLLEQDRADTVVATAPFVSEIDAIQYGIGQGPCISAAAEGAARALRVVGG